MNEINKTDIDVLAIRFGNASIEQLRNDLQYGNLEAWQVTLVEELLRYKEEEAKNKPTLLYHRRKAPEGKTFKAYEVPAFEKKGWVDSTAKFKKNIRDKLYILIKSSLQFFKKHWKFITKLIAAILAVLIPAAVALFIHFDSKNTPLNTKDVKVPSEITSTQKDSNITKQKR